MKKTEAQVHRFWNDTHNLTLILEPRGTIPEPPNNQPNQPAILSIVEQ